MAAAATPMAGLATSINPGSDLASLFECPVCFGYVLPPILQCHAGHLVCSNCRPKLTCCPTCRGQLGGNIRNLAMEKVASTVMFPCKYSSGGCTVSLLHTEKVDHEETCEFRPYSCPCPGSCDFDLQVTGLPLTFQDEMEGRGVKCSTEEIDQGIIGPPPVLAASLSLVPSSLNLWHCAHYSHPNLFCKFQ